MSAFQIITLGPRLDGISKKASKQEKLARIMVDAVEARGYPIEGQLSWIRTPKGSVEAVRSGDTVVIRKTSTDFAVVLGPALDADQVRNLFPSYGDLFPPAPRTS